MFICINKIPLLVIIKTAKIVYICIYIYGSLFIYYPYYNNLQGDHFRMPRFGNLILFLSLQKGFTPRVLRIEFKTSAIS